MGAPNSFRKQRTVLYIYEPMMMMREYHMVIWWIEKKKGELYPIIIVLCVNCIGSVKNNRSYDYTNPADIISGNIKTLR